MDQQSTSSLESYTAFRRAVEVGWPVVVRGSRVPLGREEAEAIRVREVALREGRFDDAVLVDELEPPAPAERGEEIADGLGPPASLTAAERLLRPFPHWQRVLFAWVAGKSVRAILETWGERFSMGEGDGLQASALARKWLDGQPIDAAELEACRIDPATLWDDTWQTAHANAPGQRATPPLSRPRRRRVTTSTQRGAPSEHAIENDDSPATSTAADGEHQLADAVLPALSTSSWIATAVALPGPAYPTARAADCAVRARVEHTRARAGAAAARSLPRNWWNKRRQARLTRSFYADWWQACQRALPIADAPTAEIELRTTTAPRSFAGGAPRP